MRTVLLLCMLGTSALLAAACFGDGDERPDSDQSPAASTPTLTPSTPEPTQTGRPALRSTIDGSCRITPSGAEIRVEYSASAFGATLLTRVRLLQDGREIEDSGPLEQRQFRRVATFKVEPGEQHTYRVSAEAPGASGANVQSTVRCGSQPTPSPGARA